MNNPSQQLSDHFADPYHRGECESATHAADGLLGECQLRWELLIDDGSVAEAWFQSNGCVCCEGLASLLSEWVEGREVEQVLGLSQHNFLEQLSESDAKQTPCSTLPLATLQAALESPVEAIEGDLAAGNGFGGPSLREEC